MSAFELLVMRYKDVIINFIYRSIGDYHRAEDLTQETFLRVFRNSSRYEPKSKFKNWIYLIATNLCRNEVRNRKRRNTVFFDDLVPDEDYENYPALMQDVRYLPDELYEKKRTTANHSGENQLPAGQSTVGANPRDLSRFEI